MRRIAVLNQKGGSGKTTTAVNLAATLGERGRRVLLVDIDPQSSATQWYNIEGPGRGITEIFINGSPLLDLVRATDATGVAIIPSSAWLYGAEKVLRWEAKTLQIFNACVNKLPPKQWDYMIVDCPPTLGILTANALIAVQEVLIPVEAHILALPGIDRVIASVETLRTHLNPKLQVSKILPCRVDPRTRHGREVVQELRERYGKLVSSVEIRENVRLAEAPADGMPITMFDARSKGAQDYFALADEMIADEKLLS